MASCKECIHFDRCKGLYKFDRLQKAVSKGCSYFKDHSRFVELPCKLGDEIFCATIGKIYQGIVGRIELDDEGFAIITTDGYCVDSTICYHTQEAAEQALKERENNG